MVLLPAPAGPSIAMMSLRGEGSLIVKGMIVHGGKGELQRGMMSPGQRAGVVVLINMDSADASAVAIELMKIVIADAGQQRG